MSLMNQTQKIKKAYGNLKDKLAHNAILIDIFEGNLLQYIDQDLARQLSKQSYDQCKYRLAPINLLNKIVDKISGIYQPGPMRRVIDGTDSDNELLLWYQEQLKPNQFFQDAARMFTMCKSMLVQPYIHKGYPRMRVAQNDYFFVLSDDPIDPMCPTHIVTYKTSVNEETQSPEITFTAYTDDEMLIFNDKDEIQRAQMADLDNVEGVNPFGKLPFVYLSASRNRLMPTPDSDILRMTKLIPLLISDLNYAVMFQAFSIMYGIDVDDQSIAMAPNAFWRFKSDPNTDKKPEIGVIKPQVDIEAVLSFIQSQLALWLNSRGIRPGTIGKLDKDSFASGISKMVDEMDTHEARQMLVEIMTNTETRFWDLVMNYLHPVWVQQGLIENKALFSAGAKVEVLFSTQLPMTDRGKLVADLKAEQDAGYTTAQRVIKTLNPLLSDVEIEALMKEVEESQGGEGGAVQALSLNGAQVDSLVQVLERVATGVLPKESGKSIIKAAFAIPDDVISAIIDPIVPHSVDIAKTSFGGGKSFGGGGSFGGAA